MFKAASWQTITVKYGRRLRDVFGRSGGEALRERIDQMSNVKRLLRSPPGELRDRIAGAGEAQRAAGPVRS